MAATYAPIAGAFGVMEVGYERETAAIDGLAKNAQTRTVAILMTSESGVRTWRRTRARKSRTAGWFMSMGSASMIVLQQVNDIVVVSQGRG
jgi:hypothetical protein